MLRRICALVAFCLLGCWSTEDFGRGAANLDPPDALPPDVFEGSIVDSASAGSTDATVQVTPDGGGSMEVPIWTPPGRRGVEPSLALQYNSRGSESAIGVGWSLTGVSSIQRCAADMVHEGINRRPSLEANGPLCLDGARLVVVNGADYGSSGAEYRVEVNGYRRVLQTGDLQDGGSFEVTLPNGNTQRFEPCSPVATFAMLMEKSRTPRWLHSVGTRRALRTRAATL